MSTRIAKKRIEAILSDISTDTDGLPREELQDLLSTIRGDLASVMQALNQEQAVALCGNLKEKVEVVIDYDEMAEDPTTWDGWTVYSFSRRHGAFKDPETIFEYDHETETWKPDEELQKKLDEGFAFFLSYFEHGSCIWSLKGERSPGTEGDWRWDGVDMAGLLIWEQEENGPELPDDWDYEKRQQSARAFIADYTAWCNGHVCFWSIYVLKECPTCKHVEKEVIESCGGYLQSDHQEPGEPYDPMRHLKDDVKSFTSDYEVVTVSGDAAYGVTVEEVQG